MTRKHPAHELEEDVLVRTSNMGQGRSDYEAFHTLSPAIHLREIHTHDFFELYIHLNGFPRLYVDNKIVTLQRGSLMIFPPFVMHGIISQDHPQLRASGAVHLLRDAAPAGAGTSAAGAAPFGLHAPHRVSLSAG